MSIQIIPSSRRLRCFISSQYGATAIEYALIAGGIALAIFVVVNATGQNLTTPYEAAGTGLAQ